MTIWNYAPFKWSPFILNNLRTGKNVQFFVSELVIHDIQRQEFEVLRVWAKKKKTVATDGFNVNWHAAKQPDGFDV